MRKTFSVAAFVTVFVSAFLMVFTVAGSAQQQAPAGDKDDQAVITGCVMASGYKGTAGPRSLIVWSKGDVYLETATVQTKPAERSVGTAGAREMLFYYVVHTDGPATFAAMLGAMERATHRISFETYVYTPGEVADRFTAAFEAAARRGVEVRVVLDALGAQGIDAEHI